MAVDSIKHLDGHAEKTCRFPFIDAGLHEPSGSGMPQRMWRDLAIETSEPYSALEGRLDRLTGEPFHSTTCCRTTPLACLRRR